MWWKGLQNRIDWEQETDWMTIIKDDSNSVNRTREVLSDRDLMAQIGKSRQKDVKSRDFEELAEELGI